jgi:putative transposase
MSHYRRAKRTGTSYCFTVVSYRRRNILCNTNIRAALHKAIAKVRDKSSFSIDAWVLGLISFKRQKRV